MKLDERTIVEKLDSLNEDAMTKDIIVPLYQKRFRDKFYEIEYSGGKKASEQGCDITYYEITPDTKAKEYTGIQVKQGNIDSSKNLNTGISAISIQAEQAFSREIDNTKDKAKYFIKTFIILTTGEILPNARVTIVDQFAKKNIRFINGKELSKWIIECYHDEFIDYFNMEDAADDDSDEVDPIDIILDYLNENYLEEIMELRKSFYPYGSHSTISEIIIFLLENGTSKPFEIAREIESSKEDVEEKIKEMLNDDIIEKDEDGISVISRHFNDYEMIKHEAMNRLRKLGYDPEELIDDIMKKIIE